MKLQMMMVGALAGVVSFGRTAKELETQFVFTPYDQAQTTGTPSYMPSGCPEFEVEGPRRTDGSVVRAVDFGLSESRTDNGVALKAALAECRRVKASRLELAPGSYRIHDAKGVAIESLDDFTVDGKGATLVFYRPSRVRQNVLQYDIDSDGANILVSNCTRIVLRDFNMDWDWSVDPLADFARVVARHIDTVDDASYFDLRMTDVERHPHYPEPVPVQLIGQMREDRTNIAGSGWGAGVGYAEGHFGSKNEWIAPNILRVWPCVKMPGRYESPWYNKLFTPGRNRNAVKSLPEGALVRVLHYYYGQNGMNLVGNQHLTLDNVHVWACRGLGFQVRGAQHHWLFRNVSVSVPEHLKGRRAITSTADANHTVESQGWCRFEDCRWSMHMDDMNNFHDRTMVGEKSGPNRIRLVNTRANSFLRAKPGDRIGLSEADYAPIDWVGTVTAIEGEELVFDREVPKERQECLQLHKADYATDNLIFRRCDFTDGFGRNLLQGRNLTIEDCVFHRTAGVPLCFIAEWTYNTWCEGCGVSNVVVRGCTFDGNVLQGAAKGGLVADVFSGACIRAGVELHVAGRKQMDGPPPPPDRKAISGILVERCRFLNPRGLCWHAFRGDDLIFRDNTIVVDAPDRTNLPYRGSLAFEDAVGVYVSGNRFIAAPGTVSRAGVYLPSK